MRNEQFHTLCPNCGAVTNLVCFPKMDWTLANPNVTIPVRCPKCCDHPNHIQERGE